MRSNYSNLSSCSKYVPSNDKQQININIERDNTRYALSGTLNQGNNDLSGTFSPDRQSEYYYRV
jgi:hypothetical protein